MFTKAGLPRPVAKMFVELSRALNEGLVKFEKRSAGNTTLTSFEEFVDEVFVPAFMKRRAA